MSLSGDHDLQERAQRAGLPVDRAPRVPAQPGPSRRRAEGGLLAPVAPALPQPQTQPQPLRDEAAREAPVRPTERREVRVRVSQGLAAQAVVVVVVLLVGAAAGQLLEAGPVVASLAVLSTLATRLRPGAWGPARLRRPSQLLVSLTLPVGLVAVVAAFAPSLVAAGTRDALQHGIVLVVVANLAHAVSAWLVRRSRRAARVVVVDGGAQVSAQRWGTRRGLQVVGTVSLTEADAPAVVERVVDRVEDSQADLVVVVPGPLLGSREVRRLGWQLERTGVAVAIAGLLDSIAPHRIGLGEIGGTTVVVSGSSRPAGSVRAAKWLLDRLGAALLLVPAAPVLALAALAVRLDSRGPAFFRQERVGRDGQRFTMLKLRTMHVDAEDRLRALAAADEADGLLFKIRRDPRVTRVGSLLRRSSLDELPQLINVLRGDMSLVGPRPALPQEVARYDEHVARRLVVRPGMTGLWQVSGRSDLDWESSVELDLHYADNYRITDDLRIGLRTVEAVARARGAY